MVVSEAVHNIMGGIENTGDVRLHNHRRKLKQRFDLVKKLGQGTYGKVQLGINKETGQEVAIKTIRKSKIETEADLIRIRREIQIMSSVRHPNIIHIYEVFENREKMVLVMEYAAGGELYDYLSERKILDQDDARRIFRQIATAIYYCHKHNICHRDLKLENILLDEVGNAKIADFGLSNVFTCSGVLSTFCGSPLYASPEIVKGTPYNGPEVDCWSLGVLLYTLVYGAMPFDGSNFKRLVKQISQGNYYEPKTPSPASSLIREMLTVTPTRRADISTICSHEWMNESYDQQCLLLAEELALQTPVRHDLLLSLSATPLVPQPPVINNNQASPCEELSTLNLPIRSASTGSIPPATSPTSIQPIIVPVPEMKPASVEKEPALEEGKPKPKTEGTQRKTRKKEKSSSKLAKESEKSQETTESTLATPEVPTKSNDTTATATPTPIENKMKNETQDVNAAAAEVKPAILEESKEQPAPKIPTATPVVASAAAPAPKIPTATPVVAAAAASEPKIPTATPVVASAAAPAPKIPTATPVVAAAAASEPKIPTATPVVASAAAPAPKIPTTTPVVASAAAPAPKIPTTTPVVASAAAPAPKIPTTTPVVASAAAPAPKIPTETPVVASATAPSPRISTATPIIASAAAPALKIPTATPVVASAAAPAPKIPTATPVVASAAAPAPKIPTATPVVASAAAPAPKIPTVTPIIASAAAPAPKVAITATSSTSKVPAATPTLAPPTPRTATPVAVPKKSIQPANDAADFREAEKRMSSGTSKKAAKPEEFFSLASTVALNKLVESAFRDEESPFEITPSTEEVPPPSVMPETKIVSTGTDNNANKAATLPRRKTAKAEIQLVTPQLPAENNYKSEVEHFVNKPTTNHKTEIVFSVNTPLSPNSLSKQENQSKEHIIPIQIEPGGIPPKTASPPSSWTASKSSLARTSSSKSSLSRQSTLSDSGSTISNLGAPEPIRKSPREVIIPIAVEGGGVVTPSSDRINRLISANDSEDESKNNSRCFTLRSTKRKQPERNSSAQLDTTDSLSSDEDDDNFQLLTPENLFSTLLSRVQNLTRRWNTDQLRRPSGFPQSLFSQHSSLFDDFPRNRITETRSFSRPEGAPWRREVTRMNQQQPERENIVTVHVPTVLEDDK